MTTSLLTLIATALASHLAAGIAGYLTHKARLPVDSHVLAAIAEAAAAREKAQGHAVLAELASVAAQVARDLPAQPPAVKP